MMKSEPINRLLAPNIYLFAYHLKEPANSFWQDCDAFFSQFTTATLTEYLDFSSSDRLLLKDKKDAIKITLSDSPKIEVRAQPWQIQDSYALFFNIGYDDEKEPLKEVDCHALKKLYPNGVVLLPEKENFLGQTLLITSYLPTLKKQRDAKYLQNLANNCYKALFDDNNQPLYRSGELFGSSIFEYGKKTDNYQVLIWLFRDEAADRQVNNCLNNISNLLLYRAKIVKAFAESRSIYAGLDRAYSKIEKDLDSLQNKLDNLDPSTSDYYLDDFKKELKKFAKNSLPYTRLLRKMEDFDKTIEINLFNYNETINQISGKLGMEKEELSFLQYFGVETAPHFQRQIQGDLGYFDRGTDLISQAIASIRGIVEIDQAKRDRHRQEREKLQQEKEAKRNEILQDQIQAVGVGIAAGAIVASTSGLITQPWSWPNRDRPLLPPHPFIIALVASVFCSWGAWWIVKKKIREKRSAKS